MITLQHHHTAECKIRTFQQEPVVVIAPCRNDGASEITIWFIVFSSSCSTLIVVCTVNDVYYVYIEFYGAGLRDDGSGRLNLRIWWELKSVNGVNMELRWIVFSSDTPVAE